MAGCCFSVQALFLACLFWGAWLSCIASANQGCSQNRRLKFSPPVKDNYLQGHVFYNISFEAHISCEAECLHRKECVAINIGPTIKGIKVCELCNSDHLQHPNDLRRKSGWTYRGTQNICVYKPCLNNGKCFLGYTDKKFLCECQPGYTGELCETDLDKCKDKTHQCDVNANCTNIPGSYNCTCRPGYTGNGSICKEIDECKDGSEPAHDCHINANCTNIPGSYNCTCRHDNQGRGSICYDIDECEKGSHDCHINANCTNTPGSYNCTCRPGYPGNGSICKDLDECKGKTHKCDVNANCTNIPGSYNCTCRPGYTGNGSICNEIDECKDGSHDCHINANCTNIPGSYNCTCRPGYQGNRSICKDIDECEKGSHDCHKNANCTNTAGSYKCTCRPGYTGNGSICKDVDECADNLHDCDAHANCTNIPRSYSCVCNPPYYGDGKKCILNTRGFNASTILGNDSRYLENLTLFLEPVINSSVRSRFVRCWHAKEDGWAASTFHGNCDDKGPTVTIIQVGSFIFGGYSYCQFGNSSKAFIYSLANNNGSGHAVYNPVKLQVKPDWYKYAVRRCTVTGPRFGQNDIHISNNATSNRESRTSCGTSYPLPPGYSLSGRNCTFYAGNFKFTPTDIEVFYETTT
ncbi:unnamed protein product [Porites evermanni]|uniref:Uncharacterized protein n=1 Tax=Porites evermanni TaxID=104178 RepID=A0ABN8N9F4_9CNID|nr:unnamed protein product [Porites evermanni]